MRFTVIDPFSQEQLKLRISKPGRDGHLELFDMDRGSEIARITYQGGNVGFNIDDTVVNIGNLRGGNTSGKPVGAKKGKDTDKVATDRLRNWKFQDNGDIVVTHPTTGMEVTLPKAKKPGPAAPTEDVYEILGQPEMVFSVAYAISKKQHFALSGPTGVGKTTIVRWFAKQLGYNLVIAPIARGTEQAHLVGDYLPTGPALFEWMDGPVTEAVRLSQDGPTLLLFDEMNRIGNIAEFARVYSVLDDTRKLVLKERRQEMGTAETLEVGDLIIGATMNPSDDEHADYIGVQDLDPALVSRFPVQPSVDYPEVDVETNALVGRVPDLPGPTARLMCQVAQRVRTSTEVRFPMSFRELVAWGEAIPLMGYRGAARVTVTNKAPISMRPSIEGIMDLAGEPA